MTPSARRSLALAGSVVAAGLSLLWVVVVPDKADTTSGLQALAIRWGHPASWALLSALWVAVATDGSARLRATLGWSALACYAAFVVALLL